MVPSFMAGPNGRTASPVRPLLLALLALAATLPGLPARAQSSQQMSPPGAVHGVNAATATIRDRLAVAKYSDINVGQAALPPNGHATLQLRPSGELVAEGRDNPEVDTSFSAMFTLTGEANQTFGISLPSSTTLTTGGVAQSVRIFLHDAGPTPVLGTAGNGRFNVGAVLSVGRTSESKTQVYIGAINVIVSNN